MNHATAIEIVNNQQIDPRRAVVERVVRDLRAMSEIATLELAMSVGRLVVERMFGGSLGAWRRRGKSDPTFAQLAKHPDLPMSAASLYRAVCIYEMVQNLPAISAWKWLTVSHLRSVIGLPVAEQERILSLAHANRWTVRQLERESAQVRARTNRRGGRPRVDPAVKVARKLQRILEREVRDIDTSDSDELQQAICAIRDRCDELLAAQIDELDIDESEPPTVRPSAAHAYS